MSTKAVKAVLDEGRVIVPSQEDASLLYQGGYGTLREKKPGSFLSSYEALYLLVDERLQVIDRKTKDELDFQTLLEKLRAVDAGAWTRYLIYRDLRSRGYVVRDGFGYGVDFRMYERGKYGKQAAKYIVFGVCEGTPVPLNGLAEVLRFVQGMKKELLLAVVDRRGEVVYYSVSQLTLK